jgi:hypothetical protein
MADCGIGIENAGHVKMCNASIDVFKNNKNKPYRLDCDNLKDIWNSKTRQEIKPQFHDFTSLVDGARAGPLHFFFALGSTGFTNGSDPSR